MLALDFTADQILPDQRHKPAPYHSQLPKAVGFFVTTLSGSSATGGLNTDQWSCTT